MPETVGCDSDLSVALKKKEPPGHGDVSWLSDWLIWLRHREAATLPVTGYQPLTLSTELETTYSNVTSEPVSPTQVASEIHFPQLL